MTPILNRRHLLIAGAFALGGCSATGALNALVSGSTYRLEQDMAFGTHPRQRLDVYVPLGRSANTPLAVFFFLPISDRETQRAFDWPATPADSQPVAHVSAQAPRTLLLTGRNETKVDSQRNSAVLAQLLRRDGAPVELQVLEDVGHTTIIGALATPLRGLAPVRREIIDFIGRG